MLVNRAKLRTGDSLHYVAFAACAAKGRRLLLPLELRARFAHFDPGARLRRANGSTCSKPAKKLEQRYAEVPPRMQVMVSRGEFASGQNNVWSCPAFPLRPEACR